MLIKQSALFANESGLLFYRNSPFTGVAITLLHGTMLKKHYEKGVLIGDYKNKFINVNKDCTHIDSSIFDNGEEEPCFFEDKGFTGIAYTFNGDVCVAEKEYKFGWAESVLEYDSFGNIIRLEVGNNNFYQKYHWYSNDRIRKFEIYEENHFQINLSFDSEDKLNCLWLEGDYFERIRVIHNKIFFNLFENFSFLHNISCSNYLFITGRAIHDELFGSLIDSADFGATSELRITNTSLSVDVISRLISRTKIVKLSIESDLIAFDEVRSIKMKNPSLYIELNRQEVK